MRAVRHFLKFDLVPILSTLLVCAFPCVFMYAQNALEAKPGGMLPFLLIFTVNAAIILLFTLPFFRNMSRAAFFADAAMLVIINFSLIADAVEKVFPWFWSRYLMVLFAALLLALFFLLLLKRPNMQAGCTLVMIGFLAITVMNVGLAVPDIYKSLHTTRPENEPAYETDVTFRTKDVNVYYFMFDEYGGYENLLHYFDYDNGTFLSALETRGFSVAKKSRNAEALYTDILYPNMLNMRYVKTAHDYGLYTDYYMDNTFMVQLFKQNGYQVNLVNHLDFIGDTGCNTLTTGQEKTTISQFLLENSLYWKFDFIRGTLDRIFHIDANTGYYTALRNAMETGCNSWQYAQDGPTLTLGYISCPHSPLVIGPNGEHYRQRDRYNWYHPELYIGQLEYVNAYILQLVDSIQANDPDALIILQSDHGCRMPLHEIQINARDWYDPYEENQYMCNILNCVYYQGTCFDIEGLTAINTLRSVYNQVLGTDFAQIEPVEDYLNLSTYVTRFQ